MIEEKKRYICIVIGRNESRVLNYLSGFEGAVSYSDIMQAHQYHPSLIYDNTMGQLLYRLINKKLIISANWNGEDYYQITKKGKSMLEVIKD